MRLNPKATKNKKTANRPTISQLKQRRITVLAVIIVFVVGVTGIIWSAVSTGWVENKMELAKNNVIEVTASAGMIVLSIHLFPFFINYFRGNIDKEQFMKIFYGI